MLRYVRFHTMLPGRVYRAAAVALFALSTAFAQEALNWSVSTIAGSAPSTGSADGAGNNARFFNPRGIAIDANGIAYVADTFNHTIRSISPAGVVTTLAGAAGQSGSADGVGANARFNSPAGVALDGQGNLYVADTLNQTIRKIDAAGNVSTLAGSPGVEGSDDGAGSAARFSQPVGLAVDTDGSIYVADSGNSTIRKISSTGAVTTIAGAATEAGHDDGASASARFDHPYGVAVDAAHNVLVADTFNHTVRRIAPDGSVITLAGSAQNSGSADGAGSSARFFGPSDLAADSSGNIYVTSTGNSLIRKISGGVVSTIAGSPGSSGSADGLGALAYFNSPQGLGVGPGNDVYVTDTLNSTVRKLVYAPGPTTPPPAGGPGAGRLINLSVRSRAGSGDQTLIAGFIIAGAGTKPVMVRGTGATLTNFGIGGVLADPMLTLFNASSDPISSNDSWNASPNQTAIALARGNKLGDFTIASPDAILFASLSPGPYTAQVTASTGANGVALVEVFDTDTTPPGTPGFDAQPRLVNLSARTQVGTGENVLIAGFVINGTTPKRLMIRGTGPTLKNFGVGSVLADPQLQLYAGNTVLAQNDNWQDAANVAEIVQVNGNKLGDFTLDPKDAVLVVTLPPGTYTAQISGVNDTTGVALIEVNDLQ
ncbi:MAG TPA: NHL repeat-containing protein [Opitutaceae bacterium]|nr:NHL repeat-containing protein [Opitutaceae bacterium]